MNFDGPDGATLLDPDEMQGLKFQHVTTRSELDELEQANIEQGLDWIARRRSSSIFDESFVRILHKKLFGDVWEWAGKYRHTEKNIGIDPLQIAVQLHMLLDDACYWSKHNVYLPLEAAARFHHRMVQIHPFPNGNGRHARIITDILLEDIYKHSPIAWGNDYDLQVDNARRDAYIAALRAADRGDINLLFAFVGIKTTV